MTNEHTITVGSRRSSYRHRRAGIRWCCCTAAVRGPPGVELLPQHRGTRGETDCHRPGHAGIRSLKEVPRPQLDPFGYLASAIRGPFDEMGIATAHPGTPWWGPRHCAWRWTPRTGLGKLVLDGTQIGTTRGRRADRRVEELALLAGCGRATLATIRRRRWSAGRQGDGGAPATVVRQVAVVPTRPGVALDVAAAAQGEGVHRAESGNRQRRDELPCGGCARWPASRWSARTAASR